MKMKWATAGLLVIIALAGCATTEPIWFIATPGYVEAQIATSESATRLAYEARIAQLQGELDAQRAVAGELSALVEVISEIENNNRALMGLAEELESRLAALPRVTIQLLADILQQHLDENLPE